MSSGLTALHGDVRFVDGAVYFNGVLVATLIPDAPKPSLTADFVRDFKEWCRDKSHGAGIANVEPSLS